MKRTFSLLPGAGRAEAGWGGEREREERKKQRKKEKEGECQCIYSWGSKKSWKSIIELRSGLTKVIDVKVDPLKILYKFLIYL